MNLRKLSQTEYQNQIYRLESEQQLYLHRMLEEIKQRIYTIEEKSEPLKDAVFLLKLLEEKIDQHNGQLKQRAGKMRTISYKRNHVEGY